MKNRVYLNALNLALFSSPKILYALLKIHNHNPEKAFNTTTSAFRKISSSEEVSKSFFYAQKTLHPEQEFKKLNFFNIHTLVHPDIEKNTAYPNLLTNITYAPPLLYIQGTLPDPKTSLYLGIVGSRKMSSYGEKATRTIAKELATNTITIVSGLAYGIDTVAHKAAIEVKKPTVAVVANGLDIIYPTANKKCVQEILNHSGAIVSEFPLGTYPLPRFFPQRNRIISGLSSGVFITEATFKSGSLVTAYCALEQNREVFALPGNIYNRTSEGTNDLIKRGAHLVTSAQDILTQFNLHETAECDTKNETPTLSPAEKSLFAHIGNNPISIEKLIKKVALPPHIVNSALTTLEMHGLIKNAGGGCYIKL